MSNPDPEVLKKVKQWLVYGDEDLRYAKHGLSLSEDCPYRLVAYHAQQCVEKHLKAYLVLHGVDFPYTHNISVLLELCAEQAFPAREIRDAEELTSFAITTRYPGEDEDVTETEARRTVDLAAQAREVVREALLREGIEPPGDSAA